jgi:hypothetical protein
MGFNILEVEVDMKIILRTTNSFQTFQVRLIWNYIGNLTKKIWVIIYNDKILERNGDLLKITKTKVILEIDQKFDLY